MKIETFEQGGVPWMLSRLARPTASCYDKILTPKQLKPAKSELYRAELLAEYLLGQPVEWGSSAWTERGTDMEAEARTWYEFDRDIEVQEVGFIARDDDKTGGSPDGLVGSNGGLEIKCLGAVKHMLHLMDNPPEYVGQVQGYLYLTGREWWDVLFYNPNLPKRIERIYPNLKWGEAFVPVLDEFIERLDREKARWEYARNLHPMHPDVQAMLQG